MSKKLTYEYVKEQIEKKGYRLLSKEYKNCETKLQVQCSEGHIYKVMWINFRHGSRCPICYNNKRKHTYEYVKNFIRSKKYKLLSKEYRNNHTKLQIQCTKNHKFEMTWSDFQRGVRCPICFGTSKHTYKYIKEQINKKGYKLLSKKYKNAHVKLELKCPKNHKFRMTWNDFRKGIRCPICWANSTTSKAENKIAEMIESQGIKIKRNDRTKILSPITGKWLELDIWMPELNRAIEFNGVYWHSFKYQKIKDKIKLNQCIEKGIKLLVIKERDWIDNKIGCINKIKDFVEDKTILSHSETI